MKTSKPTVTIILITATITLSLLVSCTSSTMRMVCKPGSKKIGCATFRGESAFAPGKRTTLSQEKTTSACSIGIINKADQNIDVYVDTVWQGMLEPQSKGYIPVNEANYQYVHAISYDGQYKWVAQGNCDHKRTFMVATK